MSTVRWLCNARSCARARSARKACAQKTRCEKGEEKYDREIDYLYGKLLLEKKDPVLKELILHEEGKYSRLFDNLKDNPTENAQKRLPEVEEKLALMREALACL